MHLAYPGNVRPTKNRQVLGQTGCSHRATGCWQARFALSSERGERDETGGGSIGVTERERTENLLVVVFVLREGRRKRRWGNPQFRPLQWDGIREARLEDANLLHVQRLEID